MADKDSLISLAMVFSVSDAAGISKLSICFSSKWYCYIDQAFADGQSQSGAAVLARGRGIGLGESLEKLGLLLIGHADAVFLRSDISMNE